MTALPGLPQGDQKRYRECMAEIMGVLKKYDMAGAITVVDQERCMFKYHFPTWSVAYVEPNGIRLRSKREDFGSKEEQHRVSGLTAHVIMQMRDAAVNTVRLTEAMGKIMEDKWGMQHTSHKDFDPELDH